MVTKIILGSAILVFAALTISAPVLAQSPGDTAGWTQYDYQTNGPSGNRIALDSMGGVHFVWVNCISFPHSPQAYYNYLDSTGTWAWPGVGTSIGDGLTPQISMDGDSNYGIIYSNRPNLALRYVTPEDFFFGPPGSYLWPYIAINLLDDINLLFGEWQTDDVRLLYSRSTDGGNNWSIPEIVDVLGSYSYVITASPVSQKVAMAYVFHTNYFGISDVYLIESADGRNWDWVNGKINVTEYATSPDSLTAFADCDLVYDFSDNLHVVWNAFRRVPDSLYLQTCLFHFDRNTAEITTIVGPYIPPSRGCDNGAWNIQYCKMSIASSASNNLFVIYTGWDSTDCSAGGYANGDIYCHYSSDGGANWSTSINLTNSRTPGCAPGECDSDHWSSLAERVDSYLHIFYVNDKDAGGIPQTEGVATDNPMLYLRYPISALEVDGDQPIPNSFTLSQNYPNPFNGQTMIRYNLSQAANIRLEVFDLLGRKVASVEYGLQTAGEHAANWDASDVPSGVYFYRLDTPEGEITRKMTLLK